MAKREPPVELFYDPEGLDPQAPRLRVMRNRQRFWDWKSLRFDTGLRLIVRLKRLIATREPPVRLDYDPRELDPHAPRLRISKRAGIWELRDDQGALLSSHSLLPDAVDAALERSEVCFSEILVMAANGRFEWSVRHNPELLEIARVLARPVASQREAAD